ncbi:MAG: DNA adenine methylase [Pseudomonadota bacterium]
MGPGDPFVKWAGGKRTVVPFLRPHLPRRLRTYHEPFVGGGALFFALAADEPRSFVSAQLSDLNPRLVRTYTSVRDHVEELIEALMVHAERDSEEYFYSVRQQPIDQRSDVEVAAWLLYMNRAAFNGLYRVNSKGIFNVPYGRYANPTICPAKHLRACSAFLQGVQIAHEPFTAVQERAREGDAVYFDPPYVPLSTTASFTAYTREGFGPDDQRALRDLSVALAARGVRVILSNHDTPDVRALYDEEHFTLEVVPVVRAINSKGSGRGAVAELVIVAK